jgi:phage virion morphogenesis protein
MSTDGARIELKGDKEVQRVLQQAARDGEDLTPAWRDVGEYLQREVRERFETQRDPEGEPWAPISDATAKRKGNDRILQDTGRLEGSITYEVAPLSLTQGTNLEYAAIHQFGGIIEHPEREGSVRLRATAGGELLSQAHLGKTFRNAGKMRVFASAKHKRFVERSFTVAARKQEMPARAYLGVNEENTQEIGETLMNWLIRTFRI